MDNTTNTTPVTLESIAQKKAMLLQEIRLQKEIMTGLTQEIFAPLEPATNKANAMMRAFNTGMAVFDGIVLGVKVMKKFRKISGITSKNGRNDAKRLNIRVVTVSNDDKPKNRETQRKADLRRRMVCKSLPVKE